MTITWFALIMGVAGFLVILLAVHPGTRWGRLWQGYRRRGTSNDSARHKKPQPFRDRLGLSKGPFAGAGPWR